MDRIAQVLGLVGDEVTAFDKSPRTVKARTLLCFLAHRKLGLTIVEIAGKPTICQSAVSRLSRRGEKIADEHGVELREKQSIKT